MYNAKIQRVKSFSLPPRRSLWIGLLLKAKKILVKFVANPQKSPDIGRVQMLYLHIM